MEKGSRKSAEARPDSDRRIRNWLIRIDRPRAQGRRPPPDAGMGTRAFNAPAVFSPNPTAMGSMIGSEHPSNPPFFCSFIPSEELGYGRVLRDSRDVASQPPSRHPKSAHRSARPCAMPDRRANTFLPKEESGGERQHLNHSRHDSCHDVQACPRLSQSRTAHGSQIRKHA